MLAVLLIIWYTPQNTKAQQVKKPNIIIILVDDLGWGDVGYHGGNIPTPNIDKFAKQGIELNRYYTAAVCSPTRAGLLTGRYPDRFGLRKTVIPPWSDFGVSTDEVFLPQLLEKAGYKNRAILGKWHLGHVALKYHPLNRGFTHFYGHLNGAIDYFTHTREGELDWHNDFETSHDKGYSTDLIANEAIKNIKVYQKESPFFLYIAFNAPHGPLQAKAEDLQRFGYDSTEPSFAQEGKYGAEGRGNTKTQTYAAMVNNLDGNIGRILQTLTDLNIDDNTIVLFQSDNGPAPNEAGSSGELRGKKFTEWEGGVRVPAIIRWPKGFKGGWKSEQVMGYIDVFPTLMDIAGISQKAKNGLDGLIKLYGGAKPFEEKLDALFTTPWNPKYIARNVETMIGQYCQGNQPDHEAPFSYYFIGKPEKTQKLLDYILNNLYGMKDGLTLSGMDDAGEMSAWYVLSSLGLYTFSATDPQYLVTVPQFDKVTWKINPAKPLTISNPSGKRDLKAISVNGEKSDGYFIPHSLLLNGGAITLNTK